MKKQFLVSLLGAVLSISNSFAAPTIDGLGFPPSCTGGSDGFIEFTVTGGTPPFLVCAFNTTTGTSTCVSGDTGLIPGLPLGIYTVTVVDGNNDINVTTVNIVAGPEPIILTSKTTPGCSNGGGTISMTVSNATPTINFSLTGPGVQYNGTTNKTQVDFPSTEFPNPLPEGTYQFSVVAADAKCATTTLEITNSEPILFTYHTSLLDCLTGFASLTIDTVTGGNNTPFEFSLDGNTFVFLGKLPFTVPELTAGTHTLTIKDSTCFSETANIVIDRPIQQMNVVFVTSESNSCNSTGSIIISRVLGGTSPYSFSVDGGAFTSPAQVSPDNPVRIENLSAGVHTLVVQDTNGCSSPTIEFAINPRIITFSSPQVTDVTCFNGSDGQILLDDVQISGNGIPPFTYNIGTSQSLEKPNTVGIAYTNLTAGVYPVAVVDANGCSSTAQEVVVSQPTDIAFSFKVLPPTCPGGTGTIQVNPPTGGSGGPYTFSIDGVTFQDNTTFEVPAGTYDLVVEDTKSCASKGQTVVVQDIQQIGLGFTTTGETCAGCDGVITISEVLDGEAPFTLLVDGEIVQQEVPLNELTATNLCGGPHAVQVVDSKGCASPTVTAFVGQPGPLLLTYNVTEVTENAGNDGKIVIDNVNGLGKGPFFFSIDGVDFTNTTGEFDNLVAGVYEVSIGINNGACILATIEIVVTEPMRSRIIGTKSIPATTDLFDGSLEVLTETTAPLKFRLSDVGPQGPFTDFQDSPLFTGLTTGTYFIDVEPLLDLPLLRAGLRSPQQIATPGQGNGAVGIGVVGEVPPITATFVVTPVDCITGLGGSITVSASGGTPPFTFALNGGEFQASNIFTDVSAGNNLVTIQDANGHTVSFVVNVPTVRNPTGNKIFDYIGRNYCPLC